MGLFDSVVALHSVYRYLARRRLSLAAELCDVAGLDAAALAARLFCNPRPGDGKHRRAVIVRPHDRRVADRAFDRGSLLDMDLGLAWTHPVHAVDGVPGRHWAARSTVQVSGPPPGRSTR